MKKYLRKLFLMTCMLGFASIGFAAEQYTLDPNHTYVLWHINHLGYSTQAGKFYANGTLSLDKEKPENSKVNVVINIADIATGLPELDKHLKSELFFDAKKFPKATFLSDKVVITGQNTADVTGMLNLHGVTKPVTLNVTFNKSGVNPLSNKMAAGFSAKANLKRSDFNMKTLLPMLGDDVSLEIGSEAEVANAK